MAAHTFPTGATGNQPPEITTAHLSIAPPPPFDFQANACSNGWVVLAPNAWDSERSTLQRVERLGTGKIVLLLISGSGTIDRPRIDIQVSADSADLTQKEQAEITAAVGRMFRLDEDLTEFYALCRQRGGAWTRITNGLGRLLRSPSIFEDVVKTICTTNIQWGGTVRMVQGLVNAHGACHPGDTDKRAFPTPQVIAALAPDTFAGTVRLGYRADYVHTLAARVASGEVDLEAWQDAAIPTPDLKKDLLDIKGVGNYAAATLLMLLGRYDELAVDTAFRRFVSRKYFDGQPPPSDGEAQAVYEDWGRWKYLAYWFDIWQGLDE